MTTAPSLAGMAALMIAPLLIFCRVHAFDNAQLTPSRFRSEIPPRCCADVSTNRGTTARHMCGLVAAVDDVWSPKVSSTSTSQSNKKTDLLRPEVLRQVTRILDHRGPDGHHIHHSDSDAPVQWGMGHTRLAIVDPSNRKADMPFALPLEGDRTIHLAANGEIYNHETLYKNLVEDGWTFERVSGSDCEVIAHAYSKYGGPKAVELLDGMFAFVVFEEDNKTGEIRQAFAARDPVGIKPLYYGKSGSSFVFASELKALVGHVDAETVVAMPPGHYWTPETGLVCYYNPEWLRKVMHFNACDHVQTRCYLYLISFYTPFMLKIG